MFLLCVRRDHAGKYENSSPIDILIPCSMIQAFSSRGHLPHALDGHDKYFSFPGASYFMFSSSPRSLTLKLAGNEQFWTVRLATQPSSSLWFSLLARRLSLLPLDLVSLCPNVMNPSKDSQLTPGDRAMFGQGWHTNRKGTAPSHQCPEPYLTTSPSHMFHVYFVSENLPEPYCLHIISTSAWYRVLWGCLLGGKLRSKQCAHSTRLSPILLVKYSPEQLADNPQTHTILHKRNCSTGSSQRTIMLQQLQG